MLFLILHTQKRKVIHQNDRLIHRVKCDSKHLGVNLQIVNDLRIALQNAYHLPSGYLGFIPQIDLGVIPDTLRKNTGAKKILDGWLGALACFRVLSFRCTCCEVVLAVLYVQYLHLLCRTMGQSNVNGARFFSTALKRGRNKGEGTGSKSCFRRIKKKKVPSYILICCGRKYRIVS